MKKQILPDTIIAKVYQKGLERILELNRIFLSLMVLFQVLFLIASWITDNKIYSWMSMIFFIVLMFRVSIDFIFFNPFWKKLIKKLEKDAI